MRSGDPPWVLDVPTCIHLLEESWAGTCLHLNETGHVGTGVLYLTIIPRRSLLTSRLNEAPVLKVSFCCRTHTNANLSDILEKF
jgi:hypothetical protein